MLTMQRRDLIVLTVAVGCGLLAFMMVINVMGRRDTMPQAFAVASSTRSLAVPKDMRAITLSASEIERIPDLLAVGSYVDILGIAPNYQDKMELQTIVRSAQILSLEKDESSAVKSVTTAVSPVGTEVISKATTQGKLRFILRPDGGEKNVVQFGGMGFTEVIRGVKKSKSMQAK